MNGNLKDLLSCLPKNTILAFLLVSFSLLPSLPASAFELLIGAHESDTFSHFTARALCRIISGHQSELACTVVSSTNDVDTLTNVQAGSLDLALVDSHLLHESLTGSGRFKFLDISYDRIRIIVPLYDTPVTFAVRNDASIASSSNLSGKRINIGPPGSAEKRLVETFFKARDWSDQDFTLVGELSSSLGQDRLAFNNGDYQAMVHQGVHPDRSLNRLLEHSSAHLIGLHGSEVEAMVVQNPGMSMQHIAKTTYQSFTEAIDTFGTTVALVTSADLDSETVHVLVAALMKNKSRLQAVHPALSRFTIASQDVWFGGIKVHEAVAE